MLQQRIKRVKADINSAQSEFAEAKAAHDEEWLNFLRSNLKLHHEEVKFLGLEQRRLEKQMLDVKARQPVAYPGDSSLSEMWSELAAIQETMIGEASCLQLRCNATQGPILVRECYKGLSQKIHEFFARQGKNFIIIGNSGIGKGVFLSFLMWQLASSKTTIVWESRDAGAVVKLSPLGVWEGPLAAFREDLDDPMTWYLVDGKPPTPFAAKTVLVASPDLPDCRRVMKRPRTIWRFMSPWTWGETQTAHRLIYSTQPEAEVKSRFSKWGGVPSAVFQKTEVAVQAVIQEAVDACGFVGLLKSMADLSFSPEFIQRLLHQTAEPETYLRGPVVFASEWVLEELVRRFSPYLHSSENDVLQFLETSGGVAAVSAFRSALQKRKVQEAPQPRKANGWRQSAADAEGAAATELHPHKRPMTLLASSSAAAVCVSSDQSAAASATQELLQQRAAGGACFLL